VPQEPEINRKHYIRLPESRRASYSSSQYSIYYSMARHTPRQITRTDRKDKHPQTSKVRQFLTDPPMTALYQHCNLWQFERPPASTAPISEITIMISAWKYETAWQIKLLSPTHVLSNPSFMKYAFMWRFDHIQCPRMINKRNVRLSGPLSSIFITRIWKSFTCHEAKRRCCKTPFGT
jgi:hypothetical protein